VIRVKNVVLNKYNFEFNKVITDGDRTADGQTHELKPCIGVLANAVINCSYLVGESNAGAGMSSAVLGRALVAVTQQRREVGWQRQVPAAVGDGRRRVRLRVDADRRKRRPRVGRRRWRLGGGGLGLGVLLDRLRRGGGNILAWIDITL